MSRITCDKNRRKVLWEDEMVRTIFHLLGLAVALCNPLSANAQSEKRITILYDAFGPPSSLKMDWGFAALIEYNGRRILFDTGNNARIFEHNVNQLNVDLTKLDAVVISHRHGDHTSGLNLNSGRSIPGPTRAASHGP
jgi:7,8-dihydropterin-6-yl-methyl-4-(beta-D-ribofuranosyl)aminobenzene 5'-phosphate synthase